MPTPNNRLRSRLVVLALAFFLVLAVEQDVKAQDLSCLEKVPWGNYGDVRASAAAFAPLLGLTCGGTCHEEAKQRGLAVGPQLKVLTFQQCLEYCQSLPDCEVWTWRKEEGTCEYKRAITSTSLSPLWLEDKTSDAFSGPRNCSNTAWLAPFETLALKELPQNNEATGSGVSIPCVERGKTYGQASAGSCDDFRTVEVFGNQRILELGVTQAWWPANVTNSNVTVGSAEACQTTCAIRGECGGFTFAEVEDETDGGHVPLCQLKAEASCSPALGDKEGALAGISGSCVESAEGVHPFFAECNTPRCRKPLEGTFIDDVYKPTNENCFYHFASPSEMLKCMNGSWFLISGGSNAILTYMNWVNSIKPSLLDTQKSGLRTFYVDMVDVVFDLEGNPLWVSPRTWQDMGQSDGFNGEINEAKRRALVTEWEKFTAEPVGKVRLTLVVGQYWQNPKAAWEAMTEVKTLWKDSKSMLYAQIMIWYGVCGIWNIYFCTRYSIYGLGYDRTLSLYEQEMNSFLRAVSESCRNSLGCFLAPHIAVSGPTTAMTTKMKEAISAMGNDKVHFVDALTLTALKPEENLEDHQTPVLHMWIVNVILNSICSYEGRNVACPTRVRFSKGCFGSGVEYTDCPEYYSLCQKNSDGCKKWECANSRICSQTELVISNSTQFLDVSSSSSCEPNVSATVQVSQPDSKGEGAKRVWEGETWQGWLLCVCSSLMASILVFVLQKEKKKAEYAHQGQLEKELAVQNRESDKQHKKKTFLGALGFARLIASIHIVVGHLYAKGVLENNLYMFRYGFSWVPWFFCLSGFVLTHARLNSRDPSRVDGPLVFLQKRTASVFPLYALGVILSAIITCSRDVELPDLWVLILQSWLLQSFIPVATERCIQVHCWFLSCLVLYWLLFKPVYKYIMKLKLSHTVVLMIIASLIPYLASLILPALITGDLEWYKEHKTGDIDDPVDIWTVFVKFHPLCYLHVFFFGMLLSKFRHLLVKEIKPAILERKTKINVRWLHTEKVCAMFGYTGLFFVYNLREIEPPAYKIFARLSVLMPLQGLVLLGLSLENDLLSGCFRRVPKVLVDCSYAQYVLQFICYDLWPVRVISNPSFFLFLMSASIIFTELQKQAKKIWMARKEVAVLSPFALTVGLVLMSVFWSSGKNSGLPALVKMSQNGQTYAVDVRLNLVVVSGAGKKQTVINPSITLSNGGEDLFVAGRLHSISTVTNKDVLWRDKVVTEVVTKWDSSIVVGVVPFSHWRISSGWEVEEWDIHLNLNLRNLKLVSNASDPERSHWGTPNELCEAKQVYIPSNNTLVRKIVTGAEDPKLLTLSRNAEVVLTFNSFPPPSLAKRECDKDKDGYGVQQMFVSKGQHLENENLHGVRIDCGSISKDEKNWIAFEYKGQLLYAYSVYPHKILQVRAEDGACFEKWVTAYNPLLKASMESGAQIHGSGTATLVEDEKEGNEYYLGLLHFLKKPEDVYTTMLYKFAARPPFEIMSVSRPLPLQGNTRAFASGLLYLPSQNKVVITYGVANSESRALFMDLDHVHTLFPCQG